MNANQAEATTHQSKSNIHALPKTGLTHSGVYGDFFWALIYNIKKALITVL